MFYTATGAQLSPVMVRSHVVDQLMHSPNGYVVMDPRFLEVAEHITQYILTGARPAAKKHQPKQPVAKRK